MDVYRECLSLYLERSSYRGGQDPDDVVQGFFASRLSRTDFLLKWSESGKRLRHWLVNGLVFYMREKRRERRRDREHMVDELEVEDPGEAPEAEVDRAYRTAVVQYALRTAETQCREKDQCRHWQIFIRHRTDGETYPVIAADLGITAAEAAVLARTAERRFIRAVRETVQRELPPREGIDQAIRDLLD